jgi:hypothetical protein
MGKCKCGNKYNDLTWYEVLVNGKYYPIGGKAINNKEEIAKAMKYTNYFRGAFNKDLIQHRSFNHCFNCGNANNEVVITY